MSVTMRKTTNFVGGTSTGGGDSGLSIQNQPELYTRRVNYNTPSKTFSLPKGTVLTELWVIPGHGGALPTAGTVSLIDTISLTALLLNVSATSVSKATVSPIGQLSADTKYQVTATGLNAGAEVAVGFTAILPRQQKTHA